MEIVPALDGTPTEAREYADDMAYGYCGDCDTAYLPVPTFENDGHQCDGYGLAPEFALPVTL